MESKSFHLTVVIAIFVGCIYTANLWPFVVFCLGTHLMITTEIYFKEIKNKNNNAELEQIRSDLTLIKMQKGIESFR